MKFSIIVTARKINDYLKECVSHLKNLDYKDFEVLVVVDFPEDYDFHDLRFNLISVGSLGPGEKRNIGASKSAGDILAFLDDDAYPEKDWLSKAHEIFSDPGVYALGGPAVTPRDAGFLEKMAGRVLESKMSGWGTTFRHRPGKSMEIDDYPTVNLFVRKKIFDGVGGFPIDFWPGEDTKLCLDIVKNQGRKFLYDPRPIVYHHRRNLFLPYLKQVSRYGQHRGQFARIFPDTSRLPTYFAPSVFLLGLLSGPFISLLGQFFRDLYFSILVVYILWLFIEGFNVYSKDRSIKGALYVCAGIFLTHIVYGANFLIGILKRPKLKLRKIDESSGNYLGG